MPTSSITVTDQGTGVEVATQTITEDALTKHIQRVAIDQRLTAPAEKYQIALNIAGSATLNTNLMGLRKLAANPDVYICKIIIILGHDAAGLGNPISFFRATTVAGGTLIAVADVPKLDTAAGNATLEVRTGAVTGTKAAQRLLILGGNTVATTLQAGPMYMWEATDLSQRIRLTGDEGIIMDQSPLAGDVNDDYYTTIMWEEAS